METRKNFIKEVIIILIVSVLMLAVGIGCTTYYFKKHPGDTVTNITKTEKEVTVNEEGIADSVEKVYDAVVTVNTFKKSNGDLQPYASGTGFVYKINDDDAYILTNYHVVKGASVVSVTFTSGDIVDAKVVGSDMYSDIAVLKISSDKVISVAELGSSEDARLGDTAFAVGSPVSSAYGWTVTRGILSGKDRLVTLNMADNQFSTNNVVMSLLQTDVAINSGNSGGPLCNSNGEVIGITSSKVSSTGIEGIGFAIPIEDALNTAKILEEGKEIQRPYLGISTMELSYAVYYGYTDSETKNGIYVNEVSDGLSADKAGIKKGDIITYVDDEKISSTADFRYEIYSHQVGDTVKIKLIRDGKEKEVKIKLEANSQKQ
ncbi:MAG: trypsin-like peptidase domain-containing protein [Bacilli bacterium]